MTQNGALAIEIAGDSSQPDDGVECADGSSGLVVRDGPAHVSRLWDDPLAYEIDARTGGEPRSKRVGQINGKLWAAIFTKRGNNIRLISVRRAHENETREYEKDLD